MIEAVIVTGREIETNPENVIVTGTEIESENCQGKDEIVKKDASENEKEKESGIEIVAGTGIEIGIVVRIDVRHRHGQETVETEIVTETEIMTAIEGGDRDHLVPARIILPDDNANQSSTKILHW